MITFLQPDSNSTMEDRLQFASRFGSPIASLLLPDCNDAAFCVSTDETQAALQFQSVLCFAADNPTTHFTCRAVVAADAATAPLRDMLKDIVHSRVVSSLGPLLLKHIAALWRFQDDVKSQAVWQFESPQGWQSYSAEHTALLEEAYSNGKPSVTLRTDEWMYVVAFRAMRQTNVRTSTERAIRRQEVGTQTQSQRSAVEKMHVRVTWSNAYSPALRVGFLVTISGIDNSVREAVATIEHLEKKETVELSVPILSAVAADEFEEMQDAAADHFVALRLSGDRKSVTATGIGALAAKGLAAVMAVRETRLHRAVLSSKETKLPPPDTWEKSTPASKKTDRLDIHIVSKRSAEWLEVCKQVKASLDCTIVRVERIQNTWLWQAYAFHRRALMEKNAGIDPSSLERKLFHGTHTTDPVKIYNGEAGFDLKFSQAGESTV